MSEPAYLVSDDDLERFIADPSLIQTHEQALEVIDALDSEIAKIQSQVDAAQIEANVRPLTPERQGWVKRASYACAMKRNERHKVMQRDKEIRGIKLWPGKPHDPDKKESNLLKQKRLADEVAIRRLDKQNQHLAHQNKQEELARQRREFQANREREFEWAFVNAARRVLPKDTFEEIRAAIPNPPAEVK